MLRVAGVCVFTVRMVSNVCRFSGSVLLKLEEAEEERTVSLTRRGEEVTGGSPYFSPFYECVCVCMTDVELLKTELKDIQTTTR